MMLPNAALPMAPDKGMGTGPGTRLIEEIASCEPSVYPFQLASRHGKLDFTLI